MLEPINSSLCLGFPICKIRIIINVCFVSTLSNSEHIYYGRGEYLHINREPNQEKRNAKGCDLKITLYHFQSKTFIL